MDQATNQLLKEGDDPLVLDNLEYSLTTEESKAINYNDEPKIIISASGMADAGRVRHHIKHNIYKKNCTILFVGYQAEGTLGRILLDGAKTIKLFGELISVNARIESIDYYSGHADHDKLIDWVQSFRKKPSHILLTHGEPDALAVLHRDLMALGYQATIAEYKNTFDFKSLQMFNAKGKIAPVL
jgi:metallo-beta-lactamase family protein